GRQRDEILSAQRDTVRLGLVRDNRDRGLGGNSQRQGGDRHQPQDDRLESHDRPSAKVSIVLVPKSSSTTGRRGWTVGAGAARSGVAGSRSVKLALAAFVTATSAGFRTARETLPKRSAKVRRASCSGVREKLTVRAPLWMAPRVAEFSPTASTLTFCNSRTARLRSAVPGASFWGKTEPGMVANMSTRFPLCRKPPTISSSMTRMEKARSPGGTRAAIPTVALSCRLDSSSGCPAATAFVLIRPTATFADEMTPASAPAVESWDFRSAGTMTAPAAMVCRATTMTVVRTGEREAEWPGSRGTAMYKRSAARPMPPAITAE